MSELAEAPDTRIWDAASAFIEKMCNFTSAELLPPEDGNFDIIVKVDGDIARISPDGTYQTESESLLAALKKHFEPLLQAAQVPPAGADNLPGGNVDQDGETNPDGAVPHKPKRNNAKTAEQKPPAAGSIYDRIIAMFGPTLLEVMGETGTMKSQGLISLAKQCAAIGKKVFYLDTENNVGPEGVAELEEAGVVYHYTPVLKEIDQIIKKDIPARKDDLIIIDSVGLPILRRYASLSVKERGDALLELIAWFGVLQETTYLNHSIAFVSNQQGSEFGKTSEKERGDYRPGFGDKAQYIPGAILLAKKTLDSQAGSKAEWRVWRLRRYGWGTKIFDVEVNSKGSVIKFMGVA